MLKLINFYEEEGAAKGPTTQVAVEKPETVHPDSGMFQSMKQYLGNPADKEEEKKETPPQDKKEEEVPPVVDKKLEELEAPALVDEVKKHQRLVAERETEIGELKKQLQSLSDKTQQGGDPELAKFIEELSQDFAGAYEKNRGKYKLPDIATVISQFNGGGTTARIKQFQETTLRAKIEKEFGLAEGEFEYDPKEASQAGTPSYEWDEQTRQKKAELTAEITRKNEAEARRTAQIEEQQKVDKKWIADTYFGGDETKVKDILSNMDEAMQKVTLGELSSEKHPFAMRNIIRGYHFDALVKDAVEKATSELVAKYAKHRLYLPADSAPTDLGGSKTAAAKPEVEKQASEQIKFSPMLQEIYNFTK